MRTFLATVLSVIAAGVLLVAYGLLVPRAATAPDALTYAARPDLSQTARPMLAAERVTLPDGTTAIAYVDPSTTAAPVYGAPAYAPAAAYAPAPAYATPVVRTMPVAQSESYVPVRRTVRVDRAPRRNWTKTALTIGGSTAAGAGIGAIVGGGKGAAIGAALGGGASTLFEALHH